MSDSRDDVLLTHNYDGIEEYDNPMPGWWSFIFVTNIIWAGVYVTGISLGLLPTYEVDLRADMAIQKQLEDQARQDLPPITPEVLAAGVEDSNALARGATVYKMNCAVCHGNAGEGLIGPNLTDDAWLNGDGTVASIHEVIANGTSKGMPPWGKVLGRDDQIAVTGFVTKMQGMNPPNAKPAEGTVHGKDKSDG